MDTATEEELLKKYDELPHDLRVLAERVVLEVFQEWSQTKQKRAEVLFEAHKFVGFKNISLIEGVFVVPIDKQTEVNTFIQQLKECWPLGKFECEVAAIAGVLKDWKAKFQV